MASARRRCGCWRGVRRRPGALPALKHRRRTRCWPRTCSRTSPCCAAFRSTSSWARWACSPRRSGFSCEDCHTASSNDWANYAKDVSPRKTMARQMVTMMAGDQQAVLRRPAGRHLLLVPSRQQPAEGHRRASTMLYGTPPPDELDVLVLPPAPRRPDRCADPRQVPRRPSAARERAATLTSYVAKGMYSGYGPEGSPRPVEIYARSAEPEAVDRARPGTPATTSPRSTARRDGCLRHSSRSTCWSCTARSSIRPGPTRSSSSPPTSSNCLTGMRTSNDFINDRTVLVVQGNKGAAHRHALLRRGDGAVDAAWSGRRRRPSAGCPVQMDYSDFRDVAGVKMPFKWTMTWLDGRSNFELTEVQTERANRCGAIRQAGAPEAVPGTVVGSRLAEVESGRGCEVAGYGSSQWASVAAKAAGEYSENTPAGIPEQRI